MGQVAVTLNGRSYRFDFGDGEEARLAELATFVKGRVEEIGRQFGNAGDERILLMAALLIADELWDARVALSEKAVATNEPAKDAAQEAANQPVREAAAERREQEAAPSTGAGLRLPSRDDRCRDGCPRSRSTIDLEN
jgi:cell division protein ZapA